MKKALLLLVVAFTSLPASAGTDERRFRFSYQTEVGPIPAGEGPVHVFIPLPAETRRQTVESLEITADIPGAIETEPVYGNRFWHGRLAASTGEPITVTLETVVLRRAARTPATVRSDGEAMTRDERRLFLGPNQRVVVGHEVLDPILGEIRASADEDDQADKARVIYDWVVDNVTYKKVGSGWGNGDTFWACSERYGNCTDFHALFISLARTEGIPARFEMGFPVPAERSAGTIEGYHCWVEFHVDEVGWLPIDASEASKRPEEREDFFGSQPADRIHFTTGRDLRLGPDHRSTLLNYFVYPHVEVAGEPWKGPLEREFRYAESSHGSEPSAPEARQVPAAKAESGG